MYLSRSATSGSRCHLRLDISLVFRIYLCVLLAVSYLPSPIFSSSPPSECAVCYFAAKLKPSMRADVYDTKLKLKFKGLEDHDYPFPGSIVQGDLTPLLLPGRGRLNLVCSM